MDTARRPSATVYPTMPQQFVVFMLLLTTAWAAARTRLPRLSGPGAADRARPSLAIGIDPNRDPWWKLTALPHIGPAKAARIIAFRAHSPDPRPFRQPADLLQIRGIGPKTLRAITPLLKLDAPDAPGNIPHVIH